MEPLLKDMQKYTNNLVMKATIIILFLFLKLTTFCQCQKKIKSGVTYREYGLHLIDSLKQCNVDTIVAYIKYKTKSKLNDEFNIVYLKNNKRSQILVIKNKNSSNSYVVLNRGNISSIYFDIVYEDNTQIVKYLERDDLFNDTLITDKRFIGGLASHGIGYFYYIKLGNIEVSNDYCCNIDANEKIYKRAYLLWKLTSAFNNSR